MKTTLTDAQTKTPLQHLSDAWKRHASSYPGDSPARQPVHTVYGGAQLFKATTAQRLGELARSSLETYAGDAKTLGQVLDLPTELAERVHARIVEKLETEPVEDLRIDFEDGFGNRPDDEEDHHAERTAGEVAAGMDAGQLPPFIGIRIKPLTDELRLRALRTLDGFLTTLVEKAGRLPDNFVITLPKITQPDQVSALADVLDELEPALGLDAGSLKVELMIEMPQAIVAADGSIPLPALAQAARGRCTGAHFGTYDYTAGCNIIAEHQHMLHPACDFAKHMMQVAYAGTGIWISDGATNVMPVGPHKGELTKAQAKENREVVHNAWRLHFEHATHSLTTGFYQGWDLHPAQLPTRYAALYAFFLSSLDAAGERLRNFIEQAAQATLVGDVFDDAATGQGLLNFFIRAMNCRAITEDEAVKLSGLTTDELQSRSFVQILKGRRS